MSDIPANAAAIAPPAPPPIAEVIHAVLAAAWRRRYVILLPIIVLPPVGFFLGSMAPRSYETRMSVLIQDPAKFNPFLEDLSVKTNLKERMEGLRALLMSRHVLGQVAEDLQMVPPNATEAQQSGAVAELAAGLSVTLLGQEMVEMRYRARTPEGMDRTLAQIGTRFIEKVRGPEDSSMRDSFRFLEGQWNDSQAQLQRSEQALAEFKARHAAQLPELRTANLQRMATLREQLADREVKLAGAEGEVAAMKDRLVQTNPVLGRMEQDIVAILGELALLRARYTEEHSAVQAAEGRLKRLENERQAMLKAAEQAPAVDMDRLWNLAATLQPKTEGAQPLLISQIAGMAAARDRLEQLRGETANMRASIAELATKIAGNGEVERELKGLEREAQVKAELTQQLRTRFERARVTSELATQQAPERIKIIDRPYRPSAPMKPMTVIFAGAGVAAGIGLGIALAFLLELVDGTFRRVRDVEKTTGVKVLARIPSVRRPA
ncbi:GumC family protein [Dankookia sp. GCM10030260]|uniref:GumC family protein n=1 Tax=Dankookia sp. GCM10030260 TaxID=3273390 RepID=UPI00360E0441